MSASRQRRSERSSSIIQTERQPQAVKEHPVHMQMWSQHIATCVQRTYAALGNRNTMSEPTITLQDSYQAATQRTIHKRPNQTGSAMQSWLKRSISEELSQVEGGSDKQAIENRLKKEWADMDEFDKQRIKTQHIVSVLSKRAVERRVGEELQQKLAKKQNTPWGLGDINYPMTTAEIDGFMNLFRDKEQALEMLRQSSARDMVLQSLAGAKQWIAQHAALAYVSENFNTLIEPKDKTVSGRGTWDIAEEFSSETGSLHCCSDAHFGFCRTKHKDKADDIIESARALEVLLRQFPKGSRWHKPLVFQADVVDGSDVEQKVCFFAWQCHGKINPPEPVYLIMKPTSTTAELISQGPEGTRHDFMYQDMSFPVRLRSARRPIFPDVVGKPSFTQVVFLQLKFEFAVRLTAVAPARSWSVSLLDVACDCASSDVLTAKSIVSTFTFEDLFSKKHVRNAFAFDEQEEELYKVPFPSHHPTGKKRYSKKQPASKPKPDEEDVSHDGCDDDDDIDNLFDAEVGLLRACGLQAECDLSESSGSDADYIPKKTSSAKPGKPAGADQPAELEPHPKGPCLHAVKGKGKGPATDFGMIKNILGDDRPATHVMSHVCLGVLRE
jgi:hypothetical protein